MELITSRNFLLPERQGAISGRWWYNLWFRKLWPYVELSVGDTLFWYESKTRKIVWRTEVNEIVRFPYTRKNEVTAKLRLPARETESVYFKDAPKSGFCLAYKIKPIERITISKPDAFRFPHQGWLKLTPAVRRSWRWRNAKASQHSENDRLGGSEKLTRISFNSAGWQRPTGDARKYESVNTYNHKYGFGHEDWLFRSEWLIDGWRYAFIQGVNKSHSKLVNRGQAIDLTLFTIEPDKRRRYVAVIRAAECLDDQESQDALAIFKEMGWYKTMRKEIKAVGGDDSALGATQFAKHVLNVRFRQENLNLLRADEFARADDPVVKLRRYQLYDLDCAKPHKTQRRGDHRLPRVRAWLRRGYGPVKCDPAHARMQVKLMKELKLEFPDARILRENEFIDVSVRTKAELILFEIKSDLDPRSVIRHGLGQILEYAYHPTRIHNLPAKLVIVGQRPLTVGDQEYLNRLTNQFALPLSYRVIDSVQRQ
jgi:hypothetical protein